MDDQWLKNKLWWQTMQSRSCVLSRRKGDDARFIRTVWAREGFVRDFHRLARPLPKSDKELVRVLNNEYWQTIDQSRAIHWIVRSVDNCPWGLLSLTDLSLQHRRGEVLLGILPGAPFGLGAAAMLMLFHFYFRLMKFHKLYSLVFSDNVHSLNGTLHLGFTQEGVLRQHVFDPVAQVYQDLIQTGLLAQDAFSEKNIKLMNRLLK